MNDRLSLRPMAIADLAAVQAVEREAFDSGWPATAFQHELTNNGMARYVLLERGVGDGSRLIGFGGLWLLVDQAHIVTVAVQPAERRRGYGRVLVVALLELAIAHEMSDATLEVRVSNEAARALYRGFGFHEVGERKRYYADNGEDAVIMTTEALDSDGFRARFALAKDDVRATFPGGVNGIAAG